ncbi:MAG: ATP-dependent RecD-like DNA helicase [Proteobacteria bacterium]|nr:ATP-dependent RecD-like DNA helicase [Pseudomonadota bacterium]
MAEVTLPSFERKPGEHAQTTARITRVRYVNPDNSYAILDAVTRRRIEFTMVGTLAAFKVDDEVRVKGVWVESKYGIQLKVESCEVAMPTSSVGLARFLSSQLTGIGLRMAERIIQKFGAETVDVLDNAPERLLEVQGISKKKLETIQAEWREKQGNRQLFVYLQGHGLSYDLSARLIGIYGQKLIPVLTQQPYLLSKEVNGIGFKRADQIASQMGIAPDAPMRIEAGIDYALYDAECNEGHCYLPLPVLVDAAARLLQVDASVVASHVNGLIARKSIRTDRDEHGETLVYRAFMWNLENAVAHEIVRLVRSGKHGDPDEADLRDLRCAETRLGIELADSQRQAVLTGLSEKFMVITGGPGTGKTTLVKVFVEIACGREVPVFLAAPTGRAAKRMNETTGHEAKTIHRLLEYAYMDDSHGSFQRDQDNPLPAGVYIIDEASMIDLALMRSLLKAIPDTARVIFVGDVDQLPSVGSGMVLRDMIQSNCVPVIRLRTVFRQAEQSMIVQNAHRINAGIYPLVPTQAQMADPKCEFYLFSAATPEHAEHLIEQLVCDKLPKRFGLDPMNEIQVLCPMRGNAGGVEHLNQILQARLNPDGIPLDRGFQGFRIGDRVMQLRNDYENDVYNGDIGKIVQTVGNKTIVDFDGRVVEVKHQNLENLALAYACTVHKSQGSEYPAVICAFLRSQSFMLQRNLIYTALTRARRVAVFITDQYTLSAVIGNNRPSSRYTRLSERIMAFLSADA